MAIEAAFMVPHPPLIVPEVGKGSEKQVEKTIDSYKIVAKKIASLKPETIIFSSPHATYYADHFFLSGGEVEEGSFKNFGAGEVSFTEEIDLELVKEIEKIAKTKDFPCGRIERVEEIDHGTMGPLYFIRKVVVSCLLVKFIFLFLLNLLFILDVIIFKNICG